MKNKQTYLGLPKLFLLLIIISMSVNSCKKDWTDEVGNPAKCLGEFTNTAIGIGCLNNEIVVSVFVEGNNLSEADTYDIKIYSINNQLLGKVVSLSYGKNYAVGPYNVENIAEDEVRLLIVDSESDDCFESVLLTNTCNSYGILIDLRDGQRYPTIEIGGRYWMAKNLNIGTLVNSEDYGSAASISEECYGDINPNNQTNNGSIEKYCYDNTPVNCQAYGGLYQWNEMMNYSTTPGTQGICPPSWHIPTDEEWKQLEMALGMSYAATDGLSWRGTDEGNQLKTAEDCYGSTSCGVSNFVAFLGGFRSYRGSFHSIDNYASFWSSSERLECRKWNRGLRDDRSQISRSNGTPFTGQSCRCVQD